MQLYDLVKDEGLNQFDVQAWFRSPIDPNVVQPALHVVPRYYYVLATGDDGLIALHRSPDSDARIMVRDYMSKAFNLEVKVILSYVPYFASGYILVDYEQKCSYFIANPIKLIEKKSYYVNAAALSWDDYFQSMKDSLKSLADPRVRHMLSLAVQVRAQRNLPSIRGAIDILYNISQNKSLFMQLYDMNVIKL